PACSFDRSGAHRDLHSFPTRRSSDLEVQNLIPEGLRTLDLKEFLERMEGMDPFFEDIKKAQRPGHVLRYVGDLHGDLQQDKGVLDRKSTRLNSSHVKISYAVFCLKKK